MESNLSTSSLEPGELVMPEARLRQVDFYRELELTPNRHVQGGDIVRFTEFLISITQTRVATWKVVNRDTIDLKLVFCLNSEDKTEAINPKDVWNIVLKKIPKRRKVFFGLFSVYDTCFYFQIANKFHHHPEDVGQWEVLLKEKRNILSMRLEVLWETVFTIRLRKKAPVKK